LQYLSEEELPPGALLKEKNWNPFIYKGKLLFSQVGVYICWHRDGVCRPVLSVVLPVSSSGSSSSSTSTSSQRNLATVDTQQQKQQHYRGCTCCLTECCLCFFLLAAI
jgi:hypothetical protein